MGNSPSIITRLGYDPTDLKAGLAQAKQDVANYKGQVALLEAQLTQARIQSATQFTAANRAEVEKRITDLKSELAAATGAIANKSGAQRAAAQAARQDVKEELDDQKALLKSFDDQAQKIKTLTAQKADAASQARISSAAAGAFRTAGSASGEIPGLNDLVGQILPGLTNIQTRLGGVLNSIVLLGGGIHGASQGFDELNVAGTATDGVLATLVGPTTLLGAAALALSVGAIKAAFSVGEWALNLKNLSQQTGLPIRDLEAFEVLGRATGLSVDDLVMSMRGLSKAIVDGSPVLANLKIATRDAAGNFRDEHDVLLDLSNVYKNGVDGKYLSDSEKLRVSQELLLRSGSLLIATLNKGPEALRSFFQAAGPANVDEIAASYEKWQIQVGYLEQSLHEMAGTLSEIPGLAAKGTESLNDLFKEAQYTFPDLKTILGALANAAVNPLSVPAIVTAHQYGNIPGPPPAPEAPAVPAGVYQPIKPPQVDPAITAALEKYNEAGQKELSISQQLVDAKKRLNDADAESARLQAANAQGKADKEETVKAIEDATAARRNYIELGKQQATQDNDELKFQDEVAAAAAKKADLERAAANERLAANEGITSTTHLMAQQQDYQLLSVKLESQYAELASATGARRKTLEAEINQTLDQQNSITASILSETTKELEAADKADKIKRIAAENDVLEAQLAILSKIIAIQDLGLNSHGASLDAGAGDKNFSAGLGGGELPDTDVNSPTPGQGIKPPQAPGVLDAATKSIQGFSDIIARFSGGLSKHVDETFASFEVLNKAIKQLELTNNPQGGGGGGLGGLVGGIKSSFSSGGGGILGAASGVLSGIASVGGLIGGAVGLIGGVVSGISQLFELHEKHLAENIQDEVKSIDAAFKSGNLSVTAAISGVQTEQASAITNLHGDLLQQTLDQINQELSALRAQQTATLNSFNTQLATLKTPAGLTDFDASFAQVIQTLRAASDAGASLTDQLAYLNLSMTQLAQTMTQSLNSAESQTLSLLRQDIDLQQQKIDLDTQYQQQRQQILQGVGLGPILTAGQQAAQQLLDLQTNYQNQKQALQEQQDNLSAQLDGAAQLYGFSIQQNDLENEKNAVITAQLSLQKQITAQQVQQIQNQQAALALLNQGQIPNLPTGLLPSGPDFSQIIQLVQNLGVVNHGQLVGNTALQAVFGTSDPNPANVNADQIQQLILALGGGPGSITGPGSSVNDIFKLSGVNGAQRDALMTELQDILNGILAGSFSNSNPTSFTPTLAPGAIGSTLGGVAASVAGATNTQSISIGSATIQVVLPDGTTFTPEEAATIVQSGLAQLTKNGQVGLST